MEVVDESKRNKRILDAIIAEARSLIKASKDTIAELGLNEDPGHEIIPVTAIVCKVIDSKEIMVLKSVIPMFSLSPDKDQASRALRVAVKKLNADAVIVIAESMCWEMSSDQFKSEEAAEKVMAVWGKMSEEEKGALGRKVEMITCSIDSKYGQFFSKVPFTREKMGDKIMPIWGLPEEQEGWDIVKGRLAKFIDKPPMENMA